MPPVHTRHAEERHGGGGRPGGVAIWAGVATPERRSSEIKPGIKQNRIYIVKEMF